MNLSNKLPNTTLHKVEMLLSDFAYEILTKHREPKSKKEKKFAEKICIYVGYLPLALIIAQARLTKRKNNI